ncbi:rhomboid family intramembrane serine protease [Niabella beijingensis]|uniref:rhomboid family intramembrane serine protease n=1 Tax=Niabella beijingensis TaxID=2872700 RepID=UPI001CBFA9BA|nr:rhomboid family intramembrane serine protease [Niabella beijingensis]MBZ4189539.1 rhomboid family intramembrane serine protease [Niabella beijingensis]
MSSYFTRPAEKFPPAIKYLIAINVVVWVAQLLFDAKYPPILTPDGSPVAFLTGKLALWPIGDGFQPYQLITHMFAHAASGPNKFFHILFNMFTLWMFGRILENVWGTKRFLIFYFICGLGAAALHLAVQYYTHSGSFAVGASGAVMGVLVAFAMTFPNTELYIMFIPVPVKAKWAITGLILIDLFFGLYGASGDNIAHYAHLGGAVTGFILLKIRNKTNRRNFY